MYGLCGRHTQPTPVRTQVTLSQVDLYHPQGSSTPGLDLNVRPFPFWRISEPFFGVCVQVSVYGCPCTGICVWVSLHGCLCIGVCVWVSVCGCICVCISVRVRAFVCAGPSSSARVYILVARSGLQYQRPPCGALGQIPIDIRSGNRAPAAWVPGSLFDTYPVGFASIFHEKHMYFWGCPLPFPSHSAHSYTLQPTPEL